MLDKGKYLNKQSGLLADNSLYIRKGLNVEDINPPSYIDLDTWHKGITDNDFAESINNLPAKFLPRIADFNGTDDELDLSADVNIGKIHTITVDLNANTVGTHAILGHQLLTTRWLIVTATLIGYRINAVNYTASYKVLSTDKQLQIVRNGTALEFFVDEVSKGTQTIAGVDNLDFVFNNIGARTGSFYYNGLISKIDINSTDQTSFLMYPTGQGGFDYDLVSGTIYGTWAGTGARYDYDLNGSLYLNTQGYSLWQLAANPDIQVPFDINGVALSLTAGVDIPTGYTHSYDLIPGGNKWNVADSMVGFNETESANAALAIFDRSNVTRQTAASRASIYYDATNLATKSRYHITEVSDPVIYDTFFEAASKDKFFGRVVLDGSNNIIRYDEHVVYGTQKVGSDLTKVTNYCRITDIYP